MHLNEQRTDVAIIGGGIAGLTAAYRLTKEGVPFRLFEAAHRWGGLIRTERSDGFLLDAGPDTLMAHRPEGIALCHELGLGDRLIPTRPSPHPTYVLHKEHLHALPEGMSHGVPTRLLPLAQSHLFSWLGKARMALDVAIKARREPADESLGAFFRRRLGQEALERIGEPLLAGIYSGEADRLSVRSTFPMLVEMEQRYGSLIRAMWAAAQRAPVPGRSMFFSLPEGLGELVEALVLRLPQSSLRGGVRISSIHRHREGFQIESVDGRQLLARKVIMAAPLWEAARLLVPSAPEVAVALAPMRFASSATVFLAYRAKHVQRPVDGHGFVVTRGEKLRTRACTVSSNKYAGRAPEGFVLLKGYLGGLNGTESAGAADGELCRVFEAEMQPLLGLIGRPVLARAYRWPGATPQMEVGHATRMALVERALARTSGLVVIGAGVRGSGIPNSIADGQRAADAVLQGMGAPEALAL